MLKMGAYKQTFPMFNSSWPKIGLGSFLYLGIHMKSFIAKRVNSILVNLRYLRFKFLKYKENNKKICNTFDHNFTNIPLYIMRKVSLERYYFVLYDGTLTLKISKMALNSFCDKTLHMFQMKSTVRIMSSSLLHLILFAKLMVAKVIFSLRPLQQEKHVHFDQFIDTIL